MNLSYMIHPREKNKKKTLNITHSCELYRSKQGIEMQMRTDNITRPPNKIIIENDYWCFTKYFCFLCIKPKYEEYYEY